MVITGADLWMLLNPLQVQIKSITAKSGFLLQGIVYSNTCPVCLQIDIGTTFFVHFLKTENKKEINI